MLTQNANFTPNCIWRDMTRPGPVAHARSHVAKKAWRRQPRSARATQHRQAKKNLSWRSGQCETDASLQ